MGFTLQSQFLLTEVVVGALTTSFNKNEATTGAKVTLGGAGRSRGLQFASSTEAHGH